MLALTLALGSTDGLELFDDQIEYHASAGVDLIVVGVAAAVADAARMRLATFDGPVVTLEKIDVPDSAAARDRLRKIALDRGAEWVIDSDATDFWWPRGESLKAVLDPIPGRYTTVQALVRAFVRGAETGESVVDRMTVRPSLLHNDARPEPAAAALRPIHRVRENGIIDADDLRFVPLRAWYPIEVLRFPIGKRDVSGADVTAGLADGSLVEDLRLRNYLRALRVGQELPPRTLPTIVDEARHAIECAAVGEVDLAGLDRHIRELEDRIATLEQRFWPRVLRRLSSMTRSSVT